MRFGITLFPALVLLALAACEPAPPAGTGGSDLGETAGHDGESCGRGLAVIMTDYASANVALLDFEGNTVSGSFISSGSTTTKLNAPLSGDVVFPSSTMDELVVIDRYPAAVLTFVDLKTAEVRAQLEVRTGFNANPQDYLQLSATRGLVTRYEENRKSGQLPFDKGDDLLVLDTESSEIEERIGLEEFREGDELARPGSLVRVGETVMMTLAGFSPSFSEAGDARLVLLDANSLDVTDVLEFPGLKNCGGLAISPEQNRVALSCTGLVNAANGAKPEASGLVILALSPEGEWQEETRFQASEFELGPFSDTLDFAREDLLLVSTYGALEGDDAGRPDRVLALDLLSGQVETLLSSKEKAFTLGDIRCVPACDVCFTADAGREVVHRFPLSERNVGAATTHRVEVDIALPPRRLGLF